MKVLLMNAEGDFDLQAPAPPQAATLIQDLELDTLFDAFAGGDEFLRTVAQAALLQSLSDAAQIAWRQEALQDCEQHRPVIETLYDLAIATLEEERKHLHFGFNTATGRLMQGISTLERCHERLHTLHQIAEAQLHGGFESHAFIQFFEVLHAQLDDDYLAEIAAQLKELHFPWGIFASARLGNGNKSTDWILHSVPHERRGRWRHWFAHQPQAYAFEIAPRDEAGGHALQEVREQALEVAARAVDQAASQVLAFFSQLRIELGFYRGALNLKAALAALQMPVCRPGLLRADTHTCEAQGLYDPCLCLTKNAAITGNDVAASQVDLIFVTGANQGGKSTFLRSLGVAQLLLQAGLFVPAAHFTGNICSGLFTHYKREEDAGMKSGKFDEELVRLDTIVDHMKPGAMILFNESFSATNEHEGAAIAAEMIEALLDKHIKVVFVTHFYELPLYFSNPARDGVLFLAAQRAEDGTRSHLILPGQPSRTAFGRDLYARIFADEARERAEPARNQAVMEPLSANT